MIPGNYHVKASLEFRVSTPIGGDPLEQRLDFNTTSYRYVLETQLHELHSPKW